MNESFNYLFKEYAVENNERVSTEKLKKTFIDQEIYEKSHENLPIACHDVFIQIQGGILMIQRDNFPAKSETWCIGGRIQRGVPLIESLKSRVKRECGLEITNITFLGCAREFFTTDPFGHGKGTDTPSFVFFGEGVGKIELDNLHKNPRIIKPEDYTEELRSSLNPYMRDFLDIAITFCK